MDIIYKYRVPIVDNPLVPIPRGAKILSAQAQEDIPYIWVIVNPENLKVVHKFVLYGTGHPMDRNHGDYIGTFQLHQGKLVFHLFHGV